MKSNILYKYNQKYLYTFYNELSGLEKNNLDKEIDSIDFKFMKNLYNNSFYEEEFDSSEIDELNCIDNMKDTAKTEYQNIGFKILQNGEYAVVVLAGGKGSRLGLEIPKGCVTLEINSEKLSIFEIYIKKLDEVYKKYNCKIKLYIMVSDDNEKETMDFFENNNYFDYGKDYILFFKQNKLPILDLDGNLLLKERDSILFGPNGNGDVFDAINESEVINDIQKNNIKYLLFVTIDNVLNNLFDPLFIGSMVCNNYEIASKVIYKKEQDSEWIFCKYKNKPVMLNPKFLNENQLNLKNMKDECVYGARNIVNHLISVNCFNKIKDNPLKYHRAFKKNNYIDEYGKQVVSDKPNTYKFEKFIFDAFSLYDDMLLYKTTEEEFLPVKTKEDIKLLEKYLFMKKSND